MLDGYFVNMREMNWEDYTMLGSTWKLEVAANNDGVENSVTMNHEGRSLIWWVAQIHKKDREERLKRILSNL